MAKNYFMFKTTAGDYDGQLGRIRASFEQGKAHIGLILGPDGVKIYKNTPLVDITLGRVSQSKINQFYGASFIAGLGLLSGFFTGVNNEIVNVTDDSGKWIGAFKDSYLDNMAVSGSTVLNSSLTYREAS